MGGNEVGFSGGGGGADGCHVTKKTGFILFLLAVGACVIVGLIVHFAGAGNMTCDDGSAGDGSASAGGSTGGEGGDGEESGGKEKVTDVRLPRHLVPEKYKVQLVPFLVPDNYTIRGYVEVTMQCVMAADNVTIHVNDLEIDESSVVVSEEGGSNEVGVESHEYDKEREFYIAKLDRKLQPDRKYVIRMSFVSHLRPGLKGFYRSVYKNDKGEDVTIATTQFQAVDARRAFPCFDEPALKAKFEVSLGRTPDRTSISNMPIKQGQQGAPMESTDEYVWDHYEESVPMSTYLVAFVVSDFEYGLSPKTGNNVEFRIWARKNALDQIEVAKSVGAKMLKHFEEYFNVAYPLPKQDMIAIPDFSAGAMENWGLITYRETALLYKEGVSAAQNLQRIAVVISHELAHQWFGNLVTPSWWTDLWLNEGFASYVEYLGVEAVMPELKLLEQFVNRVQSVMRIDALESSHPISIPVKHPDEIAEIFDRISYSKGASIIRMMDAFLSTETFRKGLTNYLNTFKYKAAVQDDLWHYLTLQAHKDGRLPNDVTVKDIMDTWTLQMGFPVITVTRDYDAGTAALKQERFLLSKSEGESKDQHDYKWWVPLTHTEPGQGNFDDTYNTLWMKPTETTKRVEGMPRGNVPVIFNLQETGYFRVNYDRRNWQMLSQQLSTDHTKIHVINRAQIIDDAFNLARAGLLDYETALGTTSYLDQETDFVVWNAAFSGFSYISVMLARTPAYGDFQEYMRNLILPLFTRIGFDAKPNDNHLDILLRTNVVKWACSLGIEDCTTKAKQSYKEWMDQTTPDVDGANRIDPNLKSGVYCSAIGSGGEDEWDFGWERYQKSNVGSEKSKLLSALACTKKLWMLNRYLNMSLTADSGIRQQDGRSVISSVAGNTVGRDLAFDFIRDKWDNVLEYYAGSSFAIPGLVKNVLSNRNTRFDVDELINFHQKNQDNLSSGEREVKQAIEKGENNFKWMNRHYEQIWKWMKEQNEVRKF